MTGEEKRMLAALLARVQPSLGARDSGLQKNVRHPPSSPNQPTLDAGSAGLRPAKECPSAASSLTSRSTHPGSQERGPPART